jgi:hypothetical protein
MVPVQVPPAQKEMDKTALAALEAPKTVMAVALDQEKKGAMPTSREQAAPGREIRLTIARGREIVLL